MHLTVDRVGIFDEPKRVAVTKPRHDRRVADLARLADHRRGPAALETGPRRIRGLVPAGVQVHADGRNREACEPEDDLVLARCHRGAHGAHRTERHLVRKRPPRVVVGRDVHPVPAHGAVPVTSLASVDPCPAGSDPPQHLGVEVDELARPLALVAHDGWSGLEAVEPERLCRRRKA